MGRGGDLRRAAVSPLGGEPGSSGRELVAAGSSARARRWRWLVALVCLLVVAVAVVSVGVLAASSAPRVHRPPVGLAKANRVAVVRVRHDFRSITPALSYRQIGRYVGAGGKLVRINGDYCWAYAGRDGRWSAVLCMSGPAPRLGA
jgi:hypothetical protein